MSASLSLSDSTAQWTQKLCDAIKSHIPDHDVRFLWVSGSLGRHEAVVGSDLETLAVVPSPSTGHSPSQHHSFDIPDLSAAPWWAAASPISAARSRFVRSPEQWQHAADGWAARPAAELGLVHLGLLADARPLDPEHPDPDFLTRLACAATRRHQAVLEHLLHDALSTAARTPTWWRRRSAVVDLKRDAAVPVVKLARWAALRAGVLSRDTGQRLRAGADPAVLPAHTWEELRGAADTVFRIRALVAAQSPGSHTVELRALPRPLSAELRDTLQVIAGAQRTLTYLHHTHHIPPYESCAKQ